MRGRVPPGQSRDTDPAVLGNPGDAYGTTTRTLMASHADILVDGPMKYFLRKLDN